MLFGIAIVSWQIDIHNLSYLWTGTVSQWMISVQSLGLNRLFLVLELAEVSFSSLFVQHLIMPFFQVPVVLRAAHRPYYGYGRRITVQTGRLKCKTGRVGWKTAVNGCDGRFPYYPTKFIIFSIFIACKNLHWICGVFKTCRRRTSWVLSINNQLYEDTNIARGLNLDQSPPF